jgi:hypothetical protein
VGAPFSTGTLRVPLSSKTLKCCRTRVLVHMDGSAFALPQGHRKCINERVGKECGQRVRHYFGLEVLSCAISMFMRSFIEFAPELSAE